MQATITQLQADVQDLREDRARGLETLASLQQDIRKLLALQTTPAPLLLAPPPSTSPTPSSPALQELSSLKSDLSELKLNVAQLTELLLKPSAQAAAKVSPASPSGGKHKNKKPKPDQSTASPSKMSEDK
jgi:hypothetical protein